MKLNKQEIIKAIQFYLEDNGVPTDERNASFAVELFFDGNKIQPATALSAEIMFTTENFSTGPYR